MEQRERLVHEASNLVVFDGNVTTLLNYWKDQLNYRFGIENFILENPTDEEVNNIIKISNNHLSRSLTLDRLTTTLQNIEQKLNEILSFTKGVSKPLQLKVKPIDFPPIQFGSFTQTSLEPATPFVKPSSFSDLKLKWKRIQVFHSIIQGETFYSRIHQCIKRIKKKT